MSAYAALTRASFKASVRDTATVFFTFAFPLLFLITFGLIFQGREVDDTGYHYIDYIAPGVLSWGVANAALFGVAFSLMSWRNDDLLRLIRLSPASIWSVLNSRAVVSLLVSVLQSVLFIGVALLPFFGLELHANWLLSLPVLVVAVSAFLALGVIVGNFSNTPEAVAAIANCIIVPMAFIAGSFFPLDMMPGWIEAVSRALPLRYVNDGMSYALNGRGDLTDYLVALGALVAYTVGFGAIALKTFRWSNKS
ncbi:ABC transporter permease [Catellatospora citrea]|uniref:ABC transporter permease n=1 Tax=Catellatospora citrea TaxID=53366 RepID=UPI0033DC2435